MLTRTAMLSVHFLVATGGCAASLPRSPATRIEASAMPQRQTITETTPAAASPTCREAACAEACDAKPVLDVCNQAFWHYAKAHGAAAMSSASPEDVVMLSTQALKYGQRVCDLGSGSACTESGRLARSRMDDDRAPPLALSFFERGCALDDASSCYEAAMMYAMGQGTKRDPAKASALKIKACAALPRRSDIDCKGLTKWHARRRGAARLHRLPKGALEADLVQEPAGAPQSRDSTSHRRCRHLPEPRQHHPPRQCGR
jgi:hypothetical protein